MAHLIRRLSADVRLNDRMQILPISMQAAYEQLDAEIGLILDYNPQPLLPDPESPCPRLVPPLSFYDQHLDERLSLKKIVLIPSFTTNLSETVDNAFKTIRDNHTALPLVHDDFPTLESMTVHLDEGPVTDATSVGRPYQVMVSYPATVLASMLSLHLNAPRWSSALLFTTRSVDGRSKRYRALNENFAPEFLMPPQDPEDDMMIPKGTWDSVDEATQEDLKHAMKRFPLLGVWQIFFVCPEAEDALKYMDRLTHMDAFPHSTFLTLAPGFLPANVDLPQSPDAIRTACGIPVSSFISATTRTKERPDLDSTVTKDSASLDESVPSRRSTRLSGKIQVNGDRPTKKPTPATSTPHSKAKVKSDGGGFNVTIPTKADATNPVEQMAASILQHAWTRSVERDSTFIVMHCGNFERIAFRHRSSQTLLMSELIDVTECKSPAYGEIHTGLFMSIIEDVLDRTRQLVQRETEMESKNPKKRKREMLQSSKGNKRPKTRAEIAREVARKLEYQQNLKAVSKEVANRTLALLRIQHHHLNSPTPASFLRVNQPKTAIKLVYKPSDYFCLTITSEVAAGATGDVHAAIIELLASTGESRVFSGVVVKLAFEPAQRKRMRHEFKVYKHLKSSAVTGIPHVFGLFEDVESDTLALVMNNVGTCLWDRRPDKKYRDFPVSKAERAAFAEVLKSIHDAGVRHRDIRPENLVVDDDGVVSIIDFDRADMKASESSRADEFEHLYSVLDGDCDTTGGLPTLGTPGRVTPSDSESETEWV